MSKYFEVLERLDRDRPQSVGARPEPGDEPALASVANRHAAVALAAEPAAVLAPEPAEDAGDETVPPAAGDQGAAPAQSPRLIEMLRGQAVGRVAARKPRAAIPLKGVDTLFNNIEALTLGRRPLTLVLAGAAPSEAVGALAVSLGAYAQEHGHPAVVAELQNTAEGPVVVRRRLRAAHLVSQNGDQQLPIDLRGSANRELLARWREEASPGAEIMFVIGPALADSVDSALLACQCDGLVIVAVQEETSRAALTAAAERARLTSTPTLGVVVDGGRDRSPAWLRRVLGAIGR